MTHCTVSVYRKQMLEVLKLAHWDIEIDDSSLKDLAILESFDRKTPEVCTKNLTTLNMKCCRIIQQASE